MTHHDCTPAPRLVPDKAGPALRLLPDKWGNIDARVDNRTLAIAFVQRAYPGATPTKEYNVLDTRTGNETRVEGRTRARAMLTRLAKV
jgi:hypothetical protein